MQLAENIQTYSNPLSNLRFLEYSVSCENVLHSLEFFQQLGFSSLPTNDIWDYPYAVITDGRCFIGLHEKEHFEQLTVQPRLCFVHDDILSTVRHLHDNSYTVLKSSLNSDAFQHTLLKGTNQAAINIMAARSFSPPPKENHKDSVLGYFRGIVMPTNKLNKSSGFWEDMGLLVMDTLDEAVVSVSANHLNMLLVNDIERDTPGLLFEHPEPESLFPHFARYGLTLEVSEQSLILDSEYLLKAPNGLHLWVKRES